MGKLLISGIKGSTFFSWIPYAITAIVIGVLFCSVFPNKIRSDIPAGPTRPTGDYAFLPSVREDYNRRVDIYNESVANLNKIADGYFAFGVLSVISLIIYAALLCRANARTEIKVYESGIEGRSFGKYLAWGDIRLFSFQLAYDQITSVEATDKKVIIHAANTRYMCYVTNGKEIQNTVFNRRNLQKGVPG